MAYNSSILADLLKARSLTPASLSNRLGIKLSELHTELQREPEPRQSFLQSIARDLALPVLIFYMSKAPQLHDALPDFRSENPHPTPKSRETLESIQLAEGIQRAMSSSRVVSRVGRLPAFPAISTTEIGAVSYTHLTLPTTPYV